jgi:hypothetical protein
MSDFLQLGLEALTFDNFYYKRGVRTYTLFKQPAFHTLESFELPLQSVVHYLPTSELELGPTEKDVFFQKRNGPILVEHVATLSTLEGNPVKKLVSPDGLIQAYRRKERNIRRLLSLDVPARDTRALPVFNYALLQHMYRYRVVPLTRYHEFWNTYNTLLATIKSTAEKLPDHHQFIRMELPEVLPSLPQLRNFRKAVNRSTLEPLTNDFTLFLAELWAWLGEESNSELLKGLDETTLSRVNLLFVLSGRYVVLNLGTLWSWRKDPTERNPKALASPKELQIQLYRFVMQLQLLQTQGERVELITTQDENGEELVVLQTPTEVVDEAEDTPELPADNSLRIQTVTSEVPVEPPKDTEESLPPWDVKPMEHVNRLAAKGLLSLAEQKRAIALSESYKKIPNPRGEGTLADLVLIDPERLTNFKKKRIPDSAFIFDKSMLETTLEDFHKTSINYALPRWTAQMVLSAQNFGVNVTGYEIEPVKDAYNEYEIHTVKLSPIGGAPSVWRFKLPIINERGEYLAGSTTYRMRIQRSDNPIRKVNSYRVALSSYYSKVFVNRSSKKAYDYNQWLVSAVTEKEQASLLRTTRGKSFDHLQVCPRVYSALGKTFKEVSTENYRFVFKSSVLKEAIGADVYDQHVKLGQFPCGLTKTGDLLLMDTQGFVSLKDGTALEHLEVILGLDRAKVPIDMAEVSYLGKEIPLAFMLGHRMGLTQLIQSLKVKPRVVTRGARLELEPEEFPIRFKDQTLVFSRFDDPKAMLILASLNWFSTEVQKYSYHEYDSPEVYETIMYNMGLGGRYTRELVSLFDGFIDPITLDVLKRLGEPTTLPELLFRSAELLTTDEHPNESDARYRRVKGYERISAVVYNELVKGIKQYRTNPHTTKARVEINPNAVWMALQNDTAVSIVEESNVIQNLKEQSNITLSGTGGRTSRSLVRRTREFHETDLGIVSEATVDNAEVGVTAFLSPNSRLDDLYGLTKTEFDPENRSSVLSATVLAHAFSDRDKKPSELLENTKKTLNALE